MIQKIFLAVCLLCMGAVANAQDSKYTTPDEEPTQRRGLFDRKKKAQQGDEERVKKSLFGGSSKSKAPIDAKYLEGACPEVGGKIQWSQNYEMPGLSAQQIYDKMYEFLKVFIKSKEHTSKSKIAVVNKSEYQIGATNQEILVFENKPLSLDQTKFNYQLIVYCEKGRCTVVMRNMSYLYEEERDPQAFPAEDMISDKEALNKAKNGFTKGGSKKFRTKTIDRKDEIFKIIGEAMAAK